MSKPLFCEGDRVRHRWRWGGSCSDKGVVVEVLGALYHVRFDGDPRTVGAMACEERDLTLIHALEQLAEQSDG